MKIKPAELKMPHFARKIVGKRKAGLPPGSVVHVGEKKAGKVTIQLIDYDSKNVRELDVKRIEECFPFREKKTVTWININGLHDTAIIRTLGSKFGLHALVMEDIAHTMQRPKKEDFENYIYIVVKMLHFDADAVDVEQVSLILGENFVISFQEREGDVFDAVRERIRSGKGVIREKGADYLTYRLLDALVDNYFVILEKVGDSIESLESELLTNPTLGTLKKINSLKRELIFLRKSVWPLREVVGGVEKGESRLIKKGTLIYFRDVYDHTIQIIEAVETFRDMLSGMTDLYLSTVSNRMNEIMKVLTIIATIFIPLTFVVGVYGMNFQYMPELSWKYGYFLVLALMLAIFGGMMLYFRGKKWL